MAMRIALPAFLALLPVACKADLDWQGSPRTGGGPAYLESYKDAYFRDLGDRFVGSRSRKELLGDLHATRVLYLGDHHGDFGLHQRQLHLLREIRDAGIRTVLGLEAVGTSDQGALAEFMLGGELTDLRNQVRRRWPDSWLEDGQVDGAFYRAVLEAARANRWPVFALEPTPRLPLFQRDEVIAENIRRAHERHPNRLLVVLVGQAHLLGEGRLIDRVGLAHIAIGARPSPRLARSTISPRMAGTFLRSISGVLFFEGMVPPQQ